MDDKEELRTVIITGLSGAGKTTALRALEDAGYTCVDNLPLALLSAFVQTMRAEPTVSRCALVVDSRLGRSIQGFVTAIPALRRSGHRLELVWLDAADDVLIRRFSQTRRRHPLGGDDLMAGLEEERKLLEPLRTQAETRIDTSDLSVHQLKAVMQDRYEVPGTGLAVSFMSFGFRHGVPSHADMVLDVRFLPNPFFVDHLRRLTGRDRAVADYVLAQPDTAAFLDHARRLLAFLLPRYEDEGKVYLTVAIGCTGGQHRSVALAEALGGMFAGERAVRIRHRDLER